MKKIAFFFSFLFVSLLLKSQTPTCFSPFDLQATYVGFDQVDISFTDTNLSSQWEVEYGTAGYVQGTGTSSIINLNPANISGLSPSTTYDLYVRAVCGPSDSSSWAGPITFMTSCPPMIAPLMEGFEGGKLPSCWEQGSANVEDWVIATTSDHVGNAGIISGSTISNGYFAYVDNSTPHSIGTTLITPFVDISALKVPILEFYRLSDNEGKTNVEFRVELWNGSSWNQVYFSDTNSLNKSWERITIQIDTNTVTGPIQARFIVDELNGNDLEDDVAIDDVYIMEAPTCIRTQAVSSLFQTATTANLSWIEENASPEWEIEYGPANFTLGSGIRILVNSNPYTLTGLSPQSNYDFYVRSVCGRGDSSFWSGPVTFTTTCPHDSLPFLETFDGPLTPTCWVEDGPTPWNYSTGAGFGASFAGDHTGNNGNYAWMDGSFNTNAEISTLTTVPIDIPLNLKAGLSYWVYYNNTNDGARNLLEVEFLDGTDWYLVDTIQTNQGPAWVNRTLKLVSYPLSGPVQVRFKVTGKHAFGLPQYNDILLDDISLFEIYPEDVGVTEIVSPAIICPGTVSPVVAVENFGSNNVTSVDIILSVDGVLDTIPYTGNILSGQTHHITLNSYLLSGGTSYNVQIYTANPNGLPDSYTSNDTLSFSNFKTGLAGNYTIDPSQAASSVNYQNFSSLVFDLNNFGVCAPVNITVAAGTYNEALVFGEIPGASATNTITIDGLDSSLVKIVDNGLSTSTIILDGSKHLVFKNLTIENTGTEHAAILFGPNAHYNTISNSVARVAPSTSSSSIAIVFSGSTSSTITNGTNASYNTILNNRIVNGYFGIRMYSRGDDPSTYNQILNNQIDSSYYYGIYAFFTDSLEIIGNSIDAVTKGNVQADGAYVFSSLNSKVNRNKIHAYDYGLYFNANATPSASTMKRRDEIVNNMVISESDYGIYTFFLDSVNIYHNSVVVRGSNPALQISATAANASIADVRNNILVGGTGAALRTNRPTSNIILALDHNIYYTSGSALVNLGGTNYADLPALQSAFSQHNINSIEGLPSFAGVNDLHIVGTMGSNSGDNSVGVTIDIDGDVRPIGNDLIVDIGADEYELLYDDAGVTAIVSPLGRICPGPISLSVDVQNYGINDIDSVLVVSVINGVFDTVWYNTTIPVSQSATVLLNPYTFSTGNLYDIQIYTTMPNGVNDIFNSNDTLSINDYRTGLSGNYTIDASIPVSSLNYHSITDAVNDLNAIGVCGPVNFEIAAGTYIEAVVIGNISGATNVNTITFDGLNSSMVTIIDNGQNTSTITLDGSSYVIFKNLTVENTGTTNSAILFGPDSDHNEISNSVLRVSPSTNTASMPVSFSGSIGATTTLGANASYNRVENNHLINGYFGIRMYSSTADPSTYNQILNNRIDSAYFYGVYTFYTDSLEIVGNVIDAYSIANANAVGAYIYYSVNTKINENQIRANLYGVYTYSYEIPSGSVSERRHELINNMIISENAEGIFTYDLDSANIYHNTIKAKGSNAALRLFATSSSSSLVDLRNNILIGSSGPALRTTGSASSMFEKMDYNIYYSSGSTLVTLGGSSYGSLATLQAGFSGYNNSSIEGLPIFAGANDLHVLGVLPNNVGDNSVGVAFDIDGDPRPIGADTIVDIGADEFEHTARDVAALNLIEPIKSSFKCYSAAENIAVNFYNFGLDSLDFTSDSVLVTVNVSGATTQSFSYSVNDNSLNGGLMLAPLDTMTVTMGPLDMSTVGTYYFDITLSMLLDSDTTNNFILDSIIVEPPFGGNIIGYDSVCTGDPTVLSVSNYVGSIQWQHSTGGAFTDIAGATGNEITVTPLINTSYRVVACDTAYSDTLTVESVNLSQPIAIDSTLQIVCGDTGTVALIATSTNPNAKFRWYEFSTGGTKLSAGGNIVSISANGDTLYYQNSPSNPNNPSTKTFYVEAITGTGGIYNVGPSDIHIGTYGAWTSTAEEQYFTVHSPTVIRTVDMFVSGALNTPFTIEITDANTSAVVFSYSGITTVTGTVTPQTVRLNAHLQPGNYAINFASNANPGVYRNSAGAVYPYTVPGEISITGNSFGLSYYFMFYNWMVGSGCSSTRDTVTATIDCLVGMDEAGNSFSNISIYPNPSKGIFQIVGNQVKEALEISIYNTNGKLVYQLDDKFTNNFDERIDISGFAKGLYFVKLQGKQSFEMRKIIIN